MKFRQMIEKAEEIAGGRNELAAVLHVKGNNITDAKRGDRGLPEKACLEMAIMLDIPLGAVIAAREAATSKDESERKTWEEYLAHAASICCLAIVTNVVTPSPGNAATGLNMHSSYVYYVKL